MARIELDGPEHRQRLLELAFVTRERLRRDDGAHNFAVMVEAIAGAEVAIGLWVDPAMPDGFSVALIKGEALARATLRRRDAAEHKLAVIPVRDAGMAAELRQHCGDAAVRH